MIRLIYIKSDGKIKKKLDPSVHKLHYKPIIGWKIPSSYIFIIEGSKEKPLQHHVIIQLVFDSSCYQTRSRVSLKHENDAE